MRKLTAAAAVTVSAMALFTGAALAEKLTIGLASEPTSMDPHFHNLGPNNAMSVHLFDRLIAQDEKQRLSPGLAVSWKPIDDLTWEFKLREGVKFHDGSEFNADDVICTMERAPDVPNSPSGYGTYLKGKTFKKIDDYTVHAITEAPYPLMANDISTIPVISDSAGCGAATEDFNAGTAAVGTGPFKFSNYKPGESITLVRNDDYWGDAPAWSEVEFRPIKSGPSRVAALLAGDVDMIAGVPTTDIETLKGKDNIQ
ncbi:MAG: ABC transporter substrate-binding protein, partial [Roseibium sp.]|nr:ABC transporter substrate-binding protein [Roseibium sp.]